MNIDELIKLHVEYNGKVSLVGFVLECDDLVFTHAIGFQGEFSVCLDAGKLGTNWIATFRYLLSQGIRSKFMLTFGDTEKVEFHAKIRTFDLSSPYAGREGTDAKIVFDLAGDYKVMTEEDFPPEIFGGTFSEEKPGTWL